ncbi:hypothetical protein GTO27_06885 [Candidatus Bathyarchaeota archaeon]|nr:hypothetical protein [Candidatus Bathyarchaeota archaeon]
MPISIKKDGKYDDEVKLNDYEKDVVASFHKHVDLMLDDKWYLTLKFEPVEDEAMECEVQPEYRTAKVSIDSDQLKSQPEYIDFYVRHELLHVVVWNFFDIAGTLAYKNAAQALIKLEESVIDRLEHMPMWKLVYKALEAGLDGE